MLIFTPKKSDLVRLINGLGTCSDICQGTSIR